MKGSKKANEPKCRFCGGPFTKDPSDWMCYYDGRDELPVLEVHYTCLPKMVDKLKRLESRVKKLEGMLLGPTVTLTKRG